MLFLYSYSEYNVIKSGLLQRCSNCSDDARFFVAPDGGFFVIAKDGTVRHVDQLGKHFELFSFHCLLSLYASSITNVHLLGTFYIIHCFQRL